jgi:hypothetical protein
MKHTLAELEEKIAVMEVDIRNKDSQVKTLRVEAREHALNNIKRLHNIIAICNSDIANQIDIIERME